MDTAGGGPRLGEGDWSHGYWTGTPYTNQFHRELAPNWLDFAALLEGHLPPRKTEGEAFSYLELGCGTGYGLCLMAAAYPEGRFTGIDYLPDHCVQGRYLAERLGLRNVRFEDADLLALAGDPGSFRACLEEEGGWHYVVAHGVLSWVSPAVQEALGRVTARALRPGGIALLSYNTLPGWLATSSFQKLMNLERQRRTPEEALERTLAFFDELLGEGRTPTPLAAAAPLLAGNLAQLRGQRREYLLHELCNDHWQPLGVADVHRRLGTLRLTPLGSAVLPHAFPELLPVPLLELVNGEPDPLLRETRRDLILNQTFRFDLFARGTLRLGGAGWLNALGKVGVRSGPVGVGAEEPIASDYGEISPGEPTLARVRERAARGPFRLGELLEEGMGEERSSLRAVALLLHGQRLALDRSPSAQTMELALENNRTLIGLQQEGVACRHLVGSCMGSAVPFSGLEGLIYQALEEGLAGQMASSCVRMGTEALGWVLRDSRGDPIRGEKERQRAIDAAVEEFREQRLPLLRELGALPGEGGRT